MMGYKILDYNETNHTILVESGKVQLALSIPIVDKQYVSEAELEKFIISVFSEHARRQDLTSGITNKDSIRKLVETPKPIEPVVIKTLSTEEKTEKLAYNAKHDRTELIKLCDWTQLADVNLSADELAAWNKYRQDLRDLSKQSGYPWTIVWPTPPGPLLKKNIERANPDGTLHSLMGKYPALLKEYTE
jgi:hypothetical protein